ncbi:glycosyltransferase [Akkermansiaceae bacterium]|nr:glycosyltransferase [Akkermansiaceae bacterium]
MNQDLVKDLGVLSEVVLLRPHALSNKEGGGDFDFLQQGGAMLGEKILETFGRPLITIKRTYVHQRYFEWGQIDVLPSLEWNGCVYASVKDVMCHARVDDEGVRRPRLGHDGVISWLTSLLWGGFYKEKYDGIICRAAHEDGDFMRNALSWALGEAWADEMMTWALAGEAQESVNHVSSIRRALMWKSFRRSGGDTISGIVRHWWTEAGHHLKPALPTVAFLGPDGSGKSSVIDGMCEQLTRMGLQQRMMHWRPYGLKGREDLGIPVSDPHANPPRGWFESVAKLGMFFWDWWLASLTVLLHARAKTSVVVSDRYYNDLLVDPIRYRYGAGQGLARRIFKLYPKPDLVFILVGDPEVIYPRKKEVPLNVLRNQIVRYKALGRQLGETARLIDVNRPLEEVIDNVNGQVRNYLLGSPPQPREVDPDRPLRVAQFLPHYPSVEGITAYCRGLSRELNILAPGSCPIITLRTQLNNLSGDEELLHYPHSSRNPMSLPKQLLRDLENNIHELDGVVFHGAYHPKVGMIRRHLTQIGIPFIFVPHDPYVPELTQHHAFRKWVFWHLFEKYTIQNAAAVQLLADEHELPLREQGFTVPTEVIPNGCELEAVQEVPEGAHEPGSASRSRVQYMGRMDRNHKGLDLLILAFAEYVKENPDEKVDLVLTGNDWEDRGELEELAKGTGMEGRIIFTGPRPEHSLVIHSEADVVILPSRFDGFGLTIVEAMLASRPVLVSTRAGAASHVLRAGGGWVFNPEVQEIKEALAEALLNREQWAEMGRANHDYVSTQLTWEMTARKTMAMYRKYFG